MSESLLSVGMLVRVKPEHDIPPMFRDGPSEGVIERIDGTGAGALAIVIVAGKAVPYTLSELDPAAGPRTEPGSET